MTDNNLIIGNITRVRWHTTLHKISQYNYGHMVETFDENNIIITDIFEIKDSNGNITNKYPVASAVDKKMSVDKSYAMVTLDKYGNIFVRNLFDSKNPAGFDQKNSYFQDDIADKFMMSDENDVLLNYIKLGFPRVATIKNLDNHGLLYFCVEYKLHDGINPNLLNYCILLENKMLVIEDRLKDVEEKIKEQEENKVVNKVVNKQKSYFKFRFF